MEKVIMDNIRELLDDQKIPFSVLHYKYDYYRPFDDKIIKGKIYIGISNYELLNVINIDDEVPTIYKEYHCVRSWDIHEFLRKTQPKSEKDWNSLYNTSAFKMADEVLNSEGNKVELIKFKSIECTSYDYQTIMAIEAEFKVL